MKKFLTIILFMTVAIFICLIAPYYFEGDIYNADEIRVVFNNKEITHNNKMLPQSALIVDDKIMLSKDTVDILFDKWLYYDKKYETIISTTETNVAKLKLNDNLIQIGDETIVVDVPTQEINGEIYIPIEYLQDFYDIEAKYNGKIVITTSDADYITTQLNKKLYIHAYEKTLSKIIAECNVGEKINVFNFRDNPKWVIVRRENGDIGYAKMSDIVSDNPEGNLFRKMELPTAKVNLVWEYTQNYTPNRNGEEKIDAIDVVAPTWIYFKNAEGDLANTINKDYITWAHNNNYKVWATIKNDRIYGDNKIDTMKLEETSNIVTDMNKREKIISDLIDICKSYNIDGINVDFEYMKKEDVEEFSQFIRELSAMLRQNNIVSSVDVNVPDGSDNWSLCYNHYQLAEAADYLVVMTYDQYSSNSTIPGSTAELSWVENNIKKLVERDGIKPEKIVMGVPLYSRIWKIQNGKVSKSTINMNSAKSYLNRPHEWLEEEGQYYVEYTDGSATYMIWVEDENSAKAKNQLVEKYNLAGSAYWVRGQETSDFWKKIL